MLYQKIPHGTSLPSTGGLIRLYAAACNRSFMTDCSSCRPRRGSTSQTGSVFGFFACVKSTHSSPELYDGVGGTDTEKQHYSLDKIKARTELNEILWIFFGVHTANAVRIAKRLAQEKPAKLVA